MFVGLDYSDVRPSYFNLLNLKLRTAGGCNWGAAVEADAIGEQQSKRTQSGSSS